MNQFLSQMYGTGEAIGAGGAADIEKLAEAELLGDVFKEEGINVDDIEADDIMKIAHALFGDDGAIVKEAMACKCGKEDCGCGCGGDSDKCTCKSKTAAAAPVVPAAAGEETIEKKAQEADFLGRVMAHSFVQECNNMEKAAAVSQVKQAKLDKIAGGAPAVPPAEPTDKVSQLLAKIAAARDGAPAEPANPIEAEIEKRATEMAAAYLKEAGVELPQSA